MKITEKDIKQYEKEGYEGMDAGLEVSLFEYGLIWKLEENEEFRFIYGIERNGTGDYSVFDWYTLDQNTNIINYYDWVDFDSIVNFTGSESIEEWNKTELPLKIYDLIQYYGVFNIFGGYGY
jgi:hypothetical protein